MQAEQHKRMPLLPARLVVSGAWTQALPECVPARVATLWRDGESFEVANARLASHVKSLCKRHSFHQLDCATLRSVCELSAAQSKPNLAALQQSFETLRDLAAPPPHNMSREQRWATIINVTARVRAQWQLGRGTPWTSHGPNASAFFAAREGRRVFLNRKAYVQHQDLTTALQEAWVDAQEIQAWHDTEAMRSVDIYGARGIGAVPTMYGAQGTFWFTTVTKLVHDAEQMAHLLLQGKLPAELWDAANDYLQVAKAHSAMPGGALIQLEGDELIRLSPWLQTHLYHPPPPASPLKSALSLQPADTWRRGEITRRYLDEDMVVIDDLFSPEALQLLTEFVH